MYFGVSLEGGGCNCPVGFCPGTVDDSETCCGSALA